jgi:hypothetical protein
VTASDWENLEWLLGEVEFEQFGGKNKWRETFSHRRAGALTSKGNYQEGLTAGNVPGEVGES